MTSEVRESHIEQSISNWQGFDDLAHLNYHWVNSSRFENQYMRENDRITSRILEYKAPYVQSIPYVVK